MVASGAATRSGRVALHDMVVGVNGTDITRMCHKDAIALLTDTAGAAYATANKCWKQGKHAAVAVEAPQLLAVAEEGAKPAAAEGNWQRGGSGVCTVHCDSVVVREPCKRRRCAGKRASGISGVVVLFAATVKHATAKLGGAVAVTRRIEPAL